MFKAPILFGFDMVIQPQTEREWPADIGTVLRIIGFDRKGVADSRLSIGREFYTLFLGVDMHFLYPGVQYLSRPQLTRRIATRPNKR